MNSQGRIVPLGPTAEHKWLTGVWDDLMLANRKHYPQEIFELCGWEWKGETYLLEDVPRRSSSPDAPKVIGLNTGSSNVWTTRLWPEESWRQLALQIRSLGHEVLFLGGPLEHDRNLRLQQATGGRYSGVVPFRGFFELVESCDVLVTAVTMAMHVAIALEKPVVLFNNIFNRHEFHLYGRGNILEPGLPCQGCYKPRFDRACPVSNCMELITPDRVLQEIQKCLVSEATVSRSPG